MIRNGHAGFGRAALEKDRKAPRQRRTSTIRDPDWGPTFIKTIAYAPFPVWIYLNGNEWAKQQAAQQGISFKVLNEA